MLSWRTGETTIGQFLGTREKLYTAGIEAQLITEIYHLSEPLSLEGNEIILEFNFLSFPGFS